MRKCRFGVFRISLALFSLMIQACSPAHSEDKTTSPSQTASESAPQAGLKWSQVPRVTEASLKPADTPKVAAEDFAKGQCNLYAIRNWSWSIPGEGAPALVKPSIPLASNRATYRIVYIMGVSDMASPKAEEFAKIYNEIALKNCEAKK